MEIILLTNWFIESVTLKLRKWDKYSFFYLIFYFVLFFFPVDSEDDFMINCDR